MQRSIELMDTSYSMEHFNGGVSRRLYTMSGAEQTIIGKIPKDGGEPQTLGNIVIKDTYNPVINVQNNKMYVWLSGNLMEILDTEV